MYVEVKALTPAVRCALEAVGYGAKDIELKPADTIVLQQFGVSDGQRGFVRIVNLDTGKSEGRIGDWGGANIFTRNPVDNGRDEYTIPDNGAVIKGTTGYPRVFATIYASRAAMGRFLPSGEHEEELSAEEQNALYCFYAIKGGEYRREEMRRKRVQPATVDSLVERGYLKRARNGATQITTKGKNAKPVRA